MANDNLRYTRPRRGSADTAGRAKDNFHVVGSINRSNRTDTVGFVHRPARQRHVVNQLECSRSGIENVRSGITTLKVVRACDVVRAVGSRNEVIDITCRQWIVSSSVRNYKIVYQEICRCRTVVTYPDLGECGSRAGGTGLRRGSTVHFHITGISPRSSVNEEIKINPIPLTSRDRNSGSAVGSPDSGKYLV